MCSREDDGTMNSNLKNEQDVEANYERQRNWLLHILSAAVISSVPQEIHELLHHMRSCKTANCNYPKCLVSKQLLRHYRYCNVKFTCGVCKYVQCKLQQLVELQEKRGEQHDCKQEELKHKHNTLRGEQLKGQPECKQKELKQKQEQQFKLHNKLPVQANKIQQEELKQGQRLKRQPSLHIEPPRKRIKTAQANEIQQEGQQFELQMEPPWKRLIMETAQANEIQQNRQIEQDRQCSICEAKQLFDLPMVICFKCWNPLPKNVKYYEAVVREFHYHICMKCYKKHDEDLIQLDIGLAIPKTCMRIHKHGFEDREEMWVQCDICDAWQHQICALYNRRENKSWTEKYKCAQCCPREEEGALWNILGAKDLPQTPLSDHIEQRLTRKLEQERLQRAHAQERSYYEVPGFEKYVVRVVSMDKKIQVEPLFSELVSDLNYPSEFPYTSKGVLLFQKQEGIDVCIFAMYVQEYGMDCPEPNQRCVYLSYLDSVKYFQPSDVRTCSGDALRTFVYREILIAYLDYCKKCGFKRFHIWVSPPKRGVDYIFYRHPKSQKTPKAEQLVKWYKKVLEEAMKENIVVQYKESFLLGGEESVTQVPYFYGDYWPGRAEELIKHLRSTTKTLWVCKGKDKRDWALMKKFKEEGKLSKEFLTVELQHEGDDVEYVVDEGRDGCLLGTADNFLWYCQGNYYQFDTLRRAKYSSTMLVHYLHNPDIITCCGCKCEIQESVGFHCETCKVYNICSVCYKDDKIKTGNPHQLGFRNGVTRDTVKLVEHIRKCRNSRCGYRNCENLRKMIEHKCSYEDLDCDKCKKLRGLVNFCRTHNVN